MEIINFCGENRRILDFSFYLLNFKLVLLSKQIKIESIFQIFLSVLLRFDSFLFRYLFYFFNFKLVLKSRMKNIFNLLLFLFGRFWSRWWRSTSSINRRVNSNNICDVSTLTWQTNLWAHQTTWMEIICFLLAFLWWKTWSLRQKGHHQTVIDQEYQVRLL